MHFLCHVSFLGYHKEKCNLLPGLCLVPFRFVSLCSVPCRFVSFSCRKMYARSLSIKWLPIPSSSPNSRWRPLQFPRGNFSLVSCAGCLLRVQECFKGMKILIFSIYLLIYCDCHLTPCSYTAYTYSLLLSVLLKIVRFRRSTFDVPTR